MSRGNDARLDGSGEERAFDEHAVRHRLKLHRDTGETALYGNRDAVACPACGEPFDELFASSRASETFRPDRRIGFCVVPDGDRVLVFTHE